MGCVVNVAPSAPAAGSHGFCRRVDMNVLDVRKIDDQTVVTHAQAAGVVSATSNRNLNTVLPPEMNRCHHIGYVCAPGNQSRFAANHGVIHSACVFIAFIRRFDQCTPELSSEFNDGLLIHDILRIPDSASPAETPR